MGMPAGTSRSATIRKPQAVRAARPSGSRGPRPFPLIDLHRHCTLVAGGTLSVAALAALLGEHQRQLQRWAKSGLTEAQADELAARVGEHPSMIWPDWYEATADGVADPAPSQARRRVSGRLPARLGRYLPPEGDPGYEKALKALRERQRRSGTIMGAVTDRREAA